MPSDQSRRMNPETIGAGVHDPLDFRQFSPDEGVVVGMYGDDPDVGIVVWNLEPGQENSTHVHPDQAQIIFPLTGTGLLLKGDDEPPAPIRQGHCVIVPRGIVHGIRNTGSDRLSYLTVTTHSTAGYTRTPIGDQQVHL